MPIGFCPKSAEGLPGMMEVTGIASNFGKIENGSLRVITTVESFGAAMPEIVFALLAA